MPTNPQQLPNAFNVDEVNGANQRAVQLVLMSQPRFAFQVIDTAYVEPMAINVGLEEPLCIELVRIVNKFSTDPVLCGTAVHWIFMPTQGGAIVNSIDGLTSDPLSSYKMTFRITYKAQNGN